MKTFTNLTSNLRAFFGILRVFIIIIAAFWVLNLIFSTLSQTRWMGFTHQLVVSVGDVSILPDPAIELKSNTAELGALTLVDLRGNIRANLGSADAALGSALRRTVFPSMGVILLFSWLLVGALRSLCGNIEVGEVFSRDNLLLVRRIGWILVGYSLAGFAVQFWMAVVMDVYLNQHVVLSGLKIGVAHPGLPGALHFSASPSLFPNWGGLMTGCLVLMLTEAFRQGLNLKTENDLTV